MKIKICKHTWQFYVIPGYSKEIVSGSYGMERDYADRYKTIYVESKVIARCTKCFITNKGIK